MLSSILSFVPQSVQNKPIQQTKKYANLAPLKRDTVSFGCIGSIKQYDNIFDYNAAIILNSSKYKVPADKLKNGKISQTLKDLRTSNELFKDYEEASLNDIKWKDYSPEETREGTVQSVNLVRKERMGEWKKLFENPEEYINKEEYPELVEDLKTKDSLCFIIWNAIRSDLKSSNKHTPLKVDAKALAQTVKLYNKYGEKGLQPNGTFFEIYRNNLRDNVMDSLGLNEQDATWVKIPSLKHEPDKEDENINAIEVLSHENWCTSSAAFKARTALELGDSYIYMEHDKNGRWTPSLIMVSENGKISQIQGIANNYLIPLDKLDIVKDFFVKNKNIECAGGFMYDGPSALFEIKIAEKLATKDTESDRTLAEVIKDKDFKLVHKMLGQDVTQNDDGTIELSSYKSYYMADSARGIVIPYSMLSIDEDALLANVSKIKGDLVLYKNNDVQSYISKFPSNLKQVTGKIICSQEQFDKFSADILNAVGNNMSKVKIVRQ